MQNLFIEYVFLIMIILALVMVANKLRIAYPIILVIQKKMAQYTLQYLEERHNGDASRNEHLNNLQLRLKTDLNFSKRQLEVNDTKDDSLKNFREIYQ